MINIIHGHCHLIHGSSVFLFLSGSAEDLPLFLGLPDVRNRDCSERAFEGLKLASLV